MYLEGLLGKLSYLASVIIILLSFPFEFYIGKEFFFMMYEEFKHNTISQKIDWLKSCTSTKGVYTEAMVEKIRDDIYEIIRQPYMKYSNRKYYAISTVIYLLNIITIVAMNYVFI